MRSFVWWVPHVLKRREPIIYAVRTRYMRIYQKFGIKLPHTVKRALEINEGTDTTFWIDAIRKEMKTITPAFKFLDKGINAPLGHQKIPCHVTTNRTTNQTAIWMLTQNCYQLSHECNKRASAARDKQR
jgi:hypothetical protein